VGKRQAVGCACDRALRISVRYEKIGRHARVKGSNGMDGKSGNSKEMTSIVGFEQKKEKKKKKVEGNEGGRGPWIHVGGEIDDTVNDSSVKKPETPGSQGGESGFACPTYGKRARRGNNVSGPLTGDFQKGNENR